MENRYVPRLLICSILAAVSPATTQTAKWFEDPKLLRELEAAAENCGSDPAASKDLKTAAEFLEDVAKDYREQRLFQGSAQVALSSTRPSVRESTDDIRKDTDGDGTSETTINTRREGRETINTKIEIARGLYPDRFEASSAIDVRVSDGDIVEDVSDLSVRYGFHTNPWLEVFASLKRTSNNLINIDQRYEVGGGITLVWHSRRFTLDKDEQRWRLENPKPRKKSKNRSSDPRSQEGPESRSYVEHKALFLNPDVKTKKGEEGGWRALQHIDPTTSLETFLPLLQKCAMKAANEKRSGLELSQIRQEAHKDWQKLQATKRLRHSKLGLGFILAYNYEAEQATLKRTTTRKLGENTSRTLSESYPVDLSHPSLVVGWFIKWKPSPLWEFNTEWQRKYGLLLGGETFFRETVIVARNDNFEPIFEEVASYRDNIELLGTLKLADSVVGHVGSVKLGLTVKFDLDNAPPTWRLGQDGISAPDAHYNVDLNLIVEW